MSSSKAKQLLAEAAREKDRLRRHLLVAAAMREVLDEPVVVGGTAEQFWTADEYHQTDLDMCAPLGPQAKEKLRSLGFTEKGRHWVREDIAVAMEFPDAFIDGQMSRVKAEPISSGAALIIGVDDLYLDRLRRATMREEAEGIEYHSALAVAAGCYELIDWTYVHDRISQTEAGDSFVGESMTRIDRKIRRRVRRSLGSPTNRRSDS